MNDNETVDDVLADMLLPRFDAITAMRANNYDEIKSLIANYRDRIKAAYKREVEKFNSVIQATVSSSDAEIDHLRREREKLREALGKLRAELWNNTVIAGKKKIALYEIADTALATPATAEKSSAVGDAAKLREALEKCANWGEQIDCQLGSSDETVYAFRHERCLAHNISECARAALSAPTRNCDRFATVDEARKAHGAICEKYGKCHNGCPLNNEEHYSAFDCFEAWLFAPATEKEGGNK